MNKRILYIVVILLGITLSYWAYKVFSAKKEEMLPQHVLSKKSLELPKSAPPEELDTIFAPKSVDKDFTEEAKAEYDFKSYEKRLSLYISTFYLVDDALLTSNNDSIAILTPFYKRAFPAAFGIGYKPLLLVRNNENKKQYKIYKNALGEDWYIELEPYKGGFIISRETSNGNIYVHTEVYVNAELKIDSIFIEEHHYWNDYERTYRYKNFPLEKFKDSYLDELREINIAIDRKKRKKEGKPI